MSEVKLSVPEETLLALKLAPEAFAAELRLAAAVKLYELQRLSSGAAALLAISLSTNPRFIELIERSRERQAREGGISSAEMRRRLGLEQPED